MAKQRKQRRGRSARQQQRTAFSRFHIPKQPALCQGTKALLKTDCQQQQYRALKNATPVPLHWMNAGSDEIVQFTEHFEFSLTKYALGHVTYGKITERQCWLVQQKQVMGFFLAQAGPCPLPFSRVTSRRQPFINFFSRSPPLPCCSSTQLHPSCWVRSPPGVTMGWWREGLWKGGRARMRLHQFPQQEDQIASLYTTWGLLFYPWCRQIPHWNQWEICLCKDCRIEHSVITQLESSRKPHLAAPLSGALPSNGTDIKSKQTPLQ